jgi:hypothetical protein
MTRSGSVTKERSRPTSDAIIVPTITEHYGTTGTVKVLEMPGAKEPTDVRSTAAQ